jgi:hypothetical protein
MWVEAVIDVIGLIWPFGRNKPVEPTVVEPGASTIRVELGVRGAFTRRLNESGWLAEEVLAAGLLRQGKPYSLFGIVTGLALMDVVRPRRSKTLPREFVLALTAERVVAFALALVSEGDGTGDTVAVKIKRGERSSWPRDLVRLIDQTKGFESQGATLELGGVDRLPVAWDGNDSTDELIELLSR